MVMAVIGIVTAVGSAAYGARASRKAQKRAREDAQTQALIDGSAPNIANVGEVVAEDVQGSAAADIDESLKAMDYLYGTHIPNFGEETAGMNPMEGQIPEELEMLIEAESQQGIMGMASGGAVGTPEDVYYFGVPQIMGMMQDPNPQIQGVGMQLADQMSAMPDAGMVPATANQIQTMSMGGAVTAKKYRDGTQGGFDIEVQTPQQMIESTGFGIPDEVTYMVGDSDRVSGSDMDEGLNLIRYVTKITGLAPKTFEEAKEILNQKLFLENKSRIVDELREKFDGKYSNSYGAEGMTEAEREESMNLRTDPRTYEIEDETATALSSNKNRDGLEGLSALMNPTDEEMINYFEQSRGREMDPSAQIIQGMAYGGAVTAKKLRDGGPPQTGSRTDENLERIQQIIKESGRSKLLSQLGLSDDFGRVDQEDRLLNELIEKLNLPVDIEKEGDNYSVSKTFADEDASLQLGISRLGMSAGDQYIPPGETAYYLKGERRFADGSQGGIENYDPELDVDFIAQQEAFEELLELNELAEKGVISDARAEHDRVRLMMMLQTGRTVSDLDRKNLRKKANGGPITSDRLNQLRLR